MIDIYIIIIVISNRIFCPNNTATFLLNSSTILLGSWKRMPLRSPSSTSRPSRCLRPHPTEKGELGPKTLPFHRSSFQLSSTFHQQKKFNLSLHFDNGSFLKIQTELTTNKRERAGGVWKSHWNLKFKNVALRFDCFLMKFRKRCVWSTEIGIWKPRLPTKFKVSYRSLLIHIKFTFT